MIKDYLKRCQDLNELRGLSKTDPVVGFMAAIDPADDEAIKNMFYMMTSVMKHADANDKKRFAKQINELRSLL